MSNNQLNDVLLTLFQLSTRSLYSLENIKLIRKDYSSAGEKVS